MAPVLALVALLSKPFLLLVKLLEDVTIVTSGIDAIKKLFSRKRKG